MCPYWGSDCEAEARGWHLALRSVCIAEPILAQLGSGQTAAASVALMASKRGGCTLNFSANISTAEHPERFKKKLRWNFRQPLHALLQSLVFSLGWIPTEQHIRKKKRTPSKLNAFSLLNWFAELSNLRAFLTGSCILSHFF